MSTFNAKSQTAEHNWYVVDATDKVLGRFATEIARRLRGKHKAVYTPHVDTGDYLIITNVEKLRVTGNKFTDKIYHSYSGYPGGLKSISFEKLQTRQPSRILAEAVKGMLPKNPLGRAMFKKLKIYVGADHPHGAQQPQSIDI